MTPAHTYHGIDGRCWELNDVQQGPDPLLAAMLADEKLAESWEAGDFDYLASLDELNHHVVGTWQLHQRACFSRLSASCWELQIEHTYRN
jgi:hypothetical protein